MSIQDQTAMRSAPRLLIDRLRGALRPVAAGFACSLILALGSVSPGNAEAAGGLASPGSAGTPVKLNIGTVIWIGYGPLYIADALGLWKSHGLDVHLRVFNDPALIPPRHRLGGRRWRRGDL